MPLETQKFMHAPLYVEAVRVTDENMLEVSEWCEGTVSVTTGSHPRKFIRVNTIRPIRQRQTQAFAGDWVLKTLAGLKVYTDKPFRKDFIEVPPGYDGGKPQVLFVQNDPHLHKEP